MKRSIKWPLMLWGVVLATIAAIALIRAWFVWQHPFVPGWLALAIFMFFAMLNGTVQISRDGKKRDELDSKGGK